MTKDRKMPVYQVDACAISGEWLEEAFDTGETTTHKEWCSMVDDDENHYDFFDRYTGDPVQGFRGTEYPDYTVTPIHVIWIYPEDEEDARDAALDAQGYSF